MQRSSLLASSLLLLSFSITACTDEPAQPGVPGAPLLTAPAQVDLGAGDCGGAATGTFVLGNDGDAPLEFTLESIDPRVSVVPAGGSIPAGETQLVEVQADVPEGARAGEVLATSIVARTAGPDATTIAVAFAARGAMIELEPATIGIGEQPIGQRAARDLTVRNTGNATAYVTIASPGGEFGGGLALTELGAGSEHTSRMTYLPRDLGADTARAGIVLEGPICGARPLAIELSGEGVAGQGVLVQGGPVEFGTVTCDGADEVRTLTLVNPTELAAPFTAQMWDTDLDDVNFEVRPMQGTVPAHGQVEVTVRRRDAHGYSGPREYHSAVRIVTSLGGEQIHDVAVHEVLESAALLVTGETDFGWLPANTNASMPVTITNTGNRPARLTASTQTDLFVTVPAWLEPGATAVGWINYSQPTPVTFDGDVVFSAFGSCQRPVERAYTAGRGAYAVVQPVNAITTCGAPPATAARLWVGNPGTEPLQIRCRAAGPSPLAVTFAQAVLTVPVHGHAAFDLTMAAGDGAPGTVEAEVECLANDGARGTWQLQSTTVTRTVVAPDEHCDDVVIQL